MDRDSLEQATTTRERERERAGESESVDRDDPSQQVLASREREHLRIEMLGQLMQTMQRMGSVTSGCSVDLGLVQAERQELLSIHLQRKYTASNTGIPIEQQKPCHWKAT